MLRSRGRQTSRLVAAFLAAATITAVWTTTAVRYSTKAEQIATKVLRGDLAGLTQSLYTVASSEKHLISLEEEQTDWQYTCWQREGSPTRGQPDVTVISVVSGLPGNYPKFLRKNRLAYVAQHGYMYCELNSLDTTRIAPWTKLPWILSLLPCTDYVVHLDADALIVNHTRSLQPWLDYMVEKDIEFLVPNDFGNYAAINFGVFMVRPASWLYSFFQDLYNRCACAWGRTHDWPAEQGLLYDIMVERPDAAKRTKIIEYDRWNIMLPKIPYDMDPRDVIIHVTWAKPRPSSKKCFDDQGNDVSTAECKYDGILYLYEQLEGKYNLPKADDLLAGVEMVETHNHCQPVHSRRYMATEMTYSTSTERYASSVMDFTTQEGAITGVVIGEVACLGYRDKTCAISKFWNDTDGTGPIMPEKSGIDYV